MRITNKENLRIVNGLLKHLGLFETISGGQYPKMPLKKSTFQQIHSAMDRDMGYMRLLWDEEYTYYIPLLQYPNQWLVFRHFNKDLSFIYYDEQKGKVSKIDFMPDPNEQNITILGIGTRQVGYPLRFNQSYLMAKHFTSWFEFCNWENKWGFLEPISKNNFINWLDNPLEDKS